MSRRSTGLLLGALAGLVGTAAMTAAMDRAHRRLPPQEQYPLPPREVTDVILSDRSGRATAEAAIAAHFAFGALAGALLGALNRNVSPARGALIGLGVWAGSYFGWIPLAGILRSAQSHPIRRSAVMALAHLVWGGVTAMTLTELRRAHAGMLAPGPALDAGGRRGPRA